MPVKFLIDGRQRNVTSFCKGKFSFILGVVNEKKQRDIETMEAFLKGKCPGLLLMGGKLVSNTKDNRRKLLEQKGPGWSEEEWLALQEKYGNRCLRCGMKSKLCPDHVCSLSCGGYHGIENIQPLCVPCNYWKSTKIIEYRPDRLLG